MTAARRPDRSARASYADADARQRTARARMHVRGTYSDTIEDWLHVTPSHVHTLALLSQPAAAYHCAPSVLA